MPSGSLPLDLLYDYYVSVTVFFCGLIKFALSLSLSLSRCLQCLIVLLDIYGRHFINKIDNILNLDQANAVFVACFALLLCLVSRG